MVSKESIIAGLHLAVDKASDNPHVGFYPTAKSTVEVVTEYSDFEHLWAAAQFPNADQSDADSIQYTNLDKIAVDVPVPNDDDINAWFAAFNGKLKQPVYAQSSKFGTAKNEPEQTTDEVRQEATTAPMIIAALEDKKRPERFFQSSPSFGSIILLNGSKPVSYQPETITSLGNHAGAHFSASISWSTRRYSDPEIRMMFHVCVANAMYTFAAATIPMRALTSVPHVEYSEAEAIQKTLTHFHIDDKPQQGGCTIRFVARTADIRVTYSNHALRDLRDLRMPRADMLPRAVEQAFKVNEVGVTAFITDERFGLKDHTTRLVQYFETAQTDVYAELKFNGSFVSHRDARPYLPEDTDRIPAKMTFRDVDECILILSDGVAREHNYQKWLIQELVKMDMKAVIILVGSQTVPVQKGERVARKPLIYSIHIIHAKDMKLLAQVMPAINSHVDILLNVPYTAVHAPTDTKTPAENALIIVNSLHGALWRHRRGFTERREREKRWIEDYADIIKTYIDLDAFHDQSEGRKNAFREHLALHLATKLQKVRADKKEGRKAETPAQHRARVQTEVEQYALCLKIPTVTTGDVPKFHAVRYLFSDGMSTLSDFQFLARRPRYMGWPRSEARGQPPPWLDFYPPGLPINGAATSEIVKRIMKNPQAYTVDARMLNTMDDLPTKAKEAGLLALKQASDTRIAKWFTDFKGEPLLSDITTKFSVLRRVMHHLFYSEIDPQADHDVDLDHLAYPEPLMDEKKRFLEHTTKKFQLRENRTVQAVLDAFRTFDEDQIQTVKLLPKLPFGNLVIEGVPGSGKTIVALWVLAAIMGSSYSQTGIKATFEVLPKTEKDDTTEYIDDGLVDISDDERLNLIDPVMESTLHDESTGNEQSDEDNTENRVAIYDFPGLTFGPNKQQMTEIADATLPSEGPVSPEDMNKLLQQVMDIYKANVEELRKTLPADTDWEAFYFKWSKHFDAWQEQTFKVILTDDDLLLEEDQQDQQGQDDPTVSVPCDEVAQSPGIHKVDSTIQCHPSAMIIANQNINGDDLAAKLHAIHQKMNVPLVIVKVNNLDTERKQLVRYYMPDEYDDVDDDVTITDIMDMGVDDNTLRDFGKGQGEFAPRHHGGVFRLEAIIRAKLQAGHHPDVERELRTLADPRKPFSKDGKKSLDRDLNRIMKETLEDADVVICPLSLRSICTTAIFSIPLLFISMKHLVSMKRTFDGFNWQSILPSSSVPAIIDRTVLSALVLDLVKRSAIRSCTSTRSRSNS